MRKRLRILLDCDGILSDFVNHALDLVYEKTGDKHFEHEVTNWDVFKAIGKSHLEYHLDDAVKCDNFCGTMPVKFGTQEVVRKLEELGDVFVVTAPFYSPHWVHERYEWLKDNFNIDKKRVIHTHAKFVVDGDVLVDDSEKHIREWLDAHPGALAFLWETPYTKDIEIPGAVRTNDWNKIIELIKQRV